MTYNEELINVRRYLINQAEGARRTRSDRWQQAAGINSVHQQDALDEVLVLFHKY